MSALIELRPKSDANNRFESGPKLFGAGALVGATLCFFLSSYPLALLAAALSIGTLSLLLKSVSRVLLLLALAVLTSALTVHFLTSVTRFASLSLASYLFVFFTSLGVGALLTLQSRKERHWIDCSQASVVILLILVGWLISSAPFRANPVGYAYVLNEDNGAVFDVTARFLRDHSFSQSLFLDSGWLTGVLQGLAVAISTLGATGPSPAIQVVESVLRIYALIAALTSVASGLVVASALSSKNARLTQRFFWAGVGVLFSVPWIMGTIQHGHLSALVAILNLQVLLAMARVQTTSQSSASRYLLFATLVLLAFSLGGAWHPLQLLGIALSAGFILEMLRVSLSDRTLISTRSIAIVLVCALLGVMSLAGYFWRVGYLEWVLSRRVFGLFTLPGAVARVGQPLEFVVLVGALWVAARAQLQRTQYLIFALLAYLILIQGIPYFLGSAPMYGTFKTLLVVLAALCPMLLYEIVSVITLRRQRHYRHLSLSVLLGGAALFVFSGDPFSNLAFVVSSRPSASNFRGLEVALQNPQRSSVCIATHPDYTEYEMYKCSRLALGAQGLLNSPLQVFMLGNLCQVQSSELFSIAPDTLANLTIVISDPNRLTSGEGCGRKSWAGDGLDDNPEFLLGWTTAVPWGKVELVDQMGNAVQPSFSYLQGSGDYAPSEILALETSLR